MNFTDARPDNRSGGDNPAPGPRHEPKSITSKPEKMRNSNPVFMAGALSRRIYSFFTHSRPARCSRPAMPPGRANGSHGLKYTKMHVLTLRRDRVEWRRMRGHPARTASGPGPSFKPAGPRLHEKSLFKLCDMVRRSASFSLAI